jgi:alcohol dehydrogenase
MTSPDWKGLERAFGFALPTHIDYGLEASAAVAEHVAVWGTRVAIITDPGVADVGLVEPVERRLREAGIPSHVIASVEANPRSETVDDIASAVVACDADVIVGVGGGSALDAAKAAAAVASHGGGILDYEGFEVIPGPCIPVIAIPTTAGTGSEVTFWAIVTDVERHYKMAVGSHHIVPRVALVDPLLTRTLPEPTTAATCMDALTHAIEAYTARCSNPISDALALYAIELICGHVERATADGSDVRARCALMLGSLLAGIAFGNSDTAAVHAMAEALGGALDIGHGVANAICLPYVVSHNARAVPEKTARIGQAMGLPASSSELTSASQETVTELHDLMRRLAIPTLRDLGVHESHVPDLVRLAGMNTGNPDNPVPMSDGDFEALFLEALKPAPINQANTENGMGD